MRERDRMKAFAPKLLVVFSFLFVLAALQVAGGDVVIPTAFYLPFRTTVETLAVIIFISVFAVGWWNPEHAQAKGLVRLAVGFLLVGLLDLGHLLSYPGMPDFFTVNSPDKSIAFWLAARGLESALLLGFALTNVRRAHSRKEHPVSRTAILTVGIVCGLAVYIIILGFPWVLPKFYVNGHQTATKVRVEYLIIGLLVLAIMAYHVRLRNRRLKRPLAVFRSDEADFLLILFFAILSEWTFTQYNATTGLADAMGHVYKALDVLLIYRYVFIRSIREPYDRLHKVQRALQQSEQKYFVMVNALNEAILLISSAGEILEVNHVACDLTGYTREELLGRPLVFLFDPEQTSNPSDFEDWLRQEGALPFETQSLRRDGEVIPVEVRARHVEDYAGDAFLLTVTDLRERREARKQKERAQAVFDNAVEGIMVLDAEGVIETVNSAFTEITGYRPDEVIGSKPERLLLTDSDLLHDGYAEIIISVQTTGKWRGEIWCRRKDGASYPLWATITGLKAHEGRIQHYSVIFSDLSKQEELEKRLRHQITHDLITGLPNRFYYLERVKLLLERYERRSTGYAVLAFNVKGMKEINVLCGLAGGDQVLKELADRLTTLLSERDVLGRWEGDEFILWLPKVASPEHIVPVLQKVQEAMSLPFQAGGRVIWVELAIGIALSQTDEHEVEDLIKAAEFAMDEARKKPGTAYHFYQPGMQEKVLERLTWENRLRSALERKEFVVYYQPQVHLKTGTLVGLEALVRWQHPELGLISPAQFIPVAEESELIIPLGEEVLRQACAQATTWLRQGVPLFHLAVNVSAKQFQHPEFVETVRRIVQETELPPDILVLEITESTAMQDVEFTRATINRLKKEGISFALDDFGTGYSSLNYLKQFPVEWLKIDRGFIQDILTHAEDAAIVEAIVQLAQGLHLKLIAEGVEQADQMTLLGVLGCDIIQGYLFSPPLPADGVQVFFNQTAEVYPRVKSV
ncbi:hypothetical protein JCM15765_22830 [Paradesulfitobacterium aromaticivorans]